MKITNVNVWGLEESIVASGYPKTNGRPASHFNTIVLDESDLTRAAKLGNADNGSGHDNFLKGIIVQFDWTISQVIFPQVERYHFIDIVSSQSKMHRLHMAKIKDFNEYVDPIILHRFIELLKEYNSETDKTARKIMFNVLVYSCPMGYELTARFSTNYLQLKTIVSQRSGHKLEEWKAFCRWALSLPRFIELTQKANS